MSLLRHWPTVPLPTARLPLACLCCVDIAARQRLSLIAGDVNREATISPSGKTNCWSGNCRVLACRRRRRRRWKLYAAEWSVRAVRVLETVARRRALIRGRRNGRRDDRRIVRRTSGRRRQVTVSTERRQNCTFRRKSFHSANRCREATKMGCRTRQLLRHKHVGLGTRCTNRTHFTPLCLSILHWHFLFSNAQRKRLVLIHLYSPNM